MALPVFSQLESGGEMSQISAIRCSTTLAASLDWSFDAYVVAIYALSVPLITTDSYIPGVVLTGTIGVIFLVGSEIGIWSGAVFCRLRS